MAHHVAEAQDMERQERMQRWVLIGLVVFTALGLGLLIATLRL